MAQVLIPGKPPAADLVSFSLMFHVMDMPIIIFNNKKPQSVTNVYKRSAKTVFFSIFFVFCLIGWNCSNFQNVSLILAGASVTRQPAMLKMDVIHFYIYPGTRVQRFSGLT